MRVFPWLAASLLLISSAVGANPPASRNARPNIILITLDTTRADRMGFLGSKGGLTPNLDALARQSAVFTHAYSHVPLTTASHATILTGTYPQFNHVSISEFLFLTSCPTRPTFCAKTGITRPPSSPLLYSIRWVARRLGLIGVSRFTTRASGFVPGGPIATKQWNVAPAKS
jgi:hypothetical protein